MCFLSREMSDYNDYSYGYDYNYGQGQYENYEEEQQEKHGMFHSVTFNGMEFNVDEYGRVVDPDRLLPVRCTTAAVFPNKTL